MEDRDWVWVVIIIGSQLLMWRIYSVILWRERRLCRKRLEIQDKNLEWYESQERIVDATERHDGRYR